MERAFGIGGLLVGAAALLGTAFALAVTPSPHEWSRWYVVLLLVLTFCFGATAALLAGLALMERPRLAFGDPYVESRGVVKPPSLSPPSSSGGHSYAGTIPWTASGVAPVRAASAEAMVISTTHFDDSTNPAYFAYLPIGNKPRRQGDDAKNVHALMRFYAADNGLIYEMSGRWMDTVQYGTPELTLKAGEIDIPSNETTRTLDIAFQYPGEDECYAFNDENRFRALTDLRFRPLGDSPVRVEVILRGSNVRARAEFELAYGRDSRLEIRRL